MFLLSSTWNELVKTAQNIMPKVTVGYFRDRLEIMPLGFHKLHDLYSRPSLLGGDLEAYCPLVKYIWVDEETSEPTTEFTWKPTAELTLEEAI